MFRASVSLNSTGIVVVPLNAKQRPFGASVTVTVPSTITTPGFTVYQTISDIFAAPSLVTISRALTVATVTLADHGLNVGDAVQVSQAGAPLDGTFLVASVTNNNTFTYTVTNSGVTASGQFAGLVPMKLTPVSALATKTATTATSLSAPVTALVLDVTGYAGGTGYITLEAIQGQN